jgi:hypothetical protein
MGLQPCQPAGREQLGDAIGVRVQAGRRDEANELTGGVPVGLQWLVGCRWSGSADDCF